MRKVSRRKSICKDKFQGCIKYKVGNRRISFWTDPWFNEEALRDQFLQIFDIARNKDITTSESFRISGWASKMASRIDEELQ